MGNVRSPCGTNGAALLIFDCTVVLYFIVQKLRCDIGYQCESGNAIEALQTKCKPSVSGENYKLWVEAWVTRFVNASQVI